MEPTPLHQMDTQLLADGQVVRFSCRVCERCVESGPDGIKVLQRGDQRAQHFGGNVSLHAEVDLETPPSAPPPVLH